MPLNKRSHAIWFFLKRYKKIYIALFFVTVAYAVLESVNISILLPLFDAILNKQGEGGRMFALLDALISRMPFKPFISIFVIAILLVVVKEVFNWVRIRLTGLGVSRVVCDVRVEIFKKFTASDYQFFLDNKQGKLMYDLVHAPGRLGNCLQYFPDLATSILMTVTIGTLLFSVSFKMTIVLMIVGVIFSVVMNILAKKISYNVGRGRVEATAEGNVAANELIDGVKQIKTAGSFDIWIDSFERSSKRFRDLQLKDFMWVNMPDRVIQLIPVLLLSGVAIFLYTKEDPAAFLSANLVTMGVYIYAFYKLSPYLASFGRLRMQIMGSLPDVEILYDLIHKETNSIKDGDREFRDFRDRIRFEDVTFAYKNAKEVLKKTDLVIEKGKVTAIVGVSGSGKTTLINLMVRLFDPDSGRITIDGIDLREIKHSSLIHLIGMVSQDTFIFNGTIRDNIIFGLDGISEGQLVEAAKLANAHGFITGFPKGYETIVGDKGLKLSGGQRQRIAIARAILRNPRILILDEATSSLDYHSEQIVQQAINEVSKNRTVVVVAHRLSTVINADKIVALDHFKIAEEGTHEELMRKNGVYKSLYESQSGAHSAQTKEPVI